MSAITAAAVKSLRDRTGAGMMDCKKALIETDGNEEQAIDLLRQWGGAKAAKRAEREMAEGLVAIARGESGMGMVAVSITAPHALSSVMCDKSRDSPSLTSMPA